MVPVGRGKQDDLSHNIYPSFPLESGTIRIGHVTLAMELAKTDTLVLDGYIGVDWDKVVALLNAAFQKMGLTTSIQNISVFLKPEGESRSLVDTFLGGDDPIFGFRTSLG